MAKDYSEYMEVRPGDKELSTLARLGEHMVNTEKQLLQAERDVKITKAKLKDIKERLIPETMREVGVLELRLTDGTVIMLDEVLSVTTPKGNKPRVLDWLEEEGHGGIIRRTLSVAFRKDQQEEADNLFKKLVEDHKVMPKQDRDYESQTLKKIVRERREEGKPVPDYITVYSAEVAKITENKPKLIFDEE